MNNAVEVCLYLQEMTMRSTIYTLFIILIFKFQSFCQLKSIFVLNEGAFDFVSQQIKVPVSLGKYDLSTGVYFTVDEIIGARFASEMIETSTSLWVAADRWIIEYDKSTGNRKRTKEIEGVRKIRVHNGKIVVTRGEYLKTLDAYVQVYDEKTLDLIYSIDQSVLPYTAENIEIIGNNAYIAVNNGFIFGQEVGKIISIDLDQLIWTETIELGAEGKNPENLVRWGDNIYTLNNKNFQGSTVSAINLITKQVDNYSLSDVQSLCGTSVLNGQSIMYQEYGETNLSNFSFSTRTSSFFKELGFSFYGMAHDVQSGFTCAGITDFSTSGEVLLYDKAYQLIARFHASVAPAYFVFILNSARNDDELLLIPNPAEDYIEVVDQGVLGELSILDTNGKLVIKSQTSRVKVDGLCPGVFTVMLMSENGLKKGKFIKLK